MQTLVRPRGLVSPGNTAEDRQAIINDVAACQQKQRDQKAVLERAQTELKEAQRLNVELQKRVKEFEAEIASIPDMVREASFALVVAAARGAK